ncbi:GntR family transcriptional regulator [Reichenbachiella ulvae]|uniref:GntR family transcriptional regulator n=1 Tax=Reichenbachiella ulvae TaxID=2980104 RepID=A0ABT3CRU2_9BACT|nr:GntR family transcriptional regulator [Reichenbachiella ulvae]MCV9386425.1 GntR family transcriptional regulator [Reichenbachiella ulvae]
MDFNDNQAIYLQIAELLCENILTQEWKPGDRIPSVRETAINMEVNPNTVMRTFNYLQEKEIIFNKRGIGYFVSEQGYAKTMELKKNDFIHQELPRIFKEMTLLNMSMKDVEALFEDYQSKNL